MNKLTMTPGRLEMWITAHTEEAWKEILLVEMLGGHRRELPDNMIYFDLQVAEDKLEKIRTAIIKYFAKDVTNPN